MLVVIVLVLLTALAASVWFSLAVFTASSENHGSISAGDLVFDLTPSGSIVDTSALKPGDTRTGTVDVANRKSGATFTLGFAGLTANPLRDVLLLTIVETQPVSKPLYDGPLSGVQPIVLGRIESGASMRLGFTFAWPSSQRDPALQGQTVPLVLQWSATT